MNTDEMTPGDQAAYNKSLEKSAKVAKAKFGTTYTCCGQEFSLATLKAHLLETHQVDIKTQKFTRSMLMHMDGRDWYASSYSWSCDAVAFEEYTKNKRAKNDMMRFA